MRLERRALQAAAEAPALAAEVRALAPSAQDVVPAVAEIVAAVREGGDALVGEYTRRFDTHGAPPQPLRVAPDELEAALAGTDPAVRAGLKLAAANVQAVARACLGEDAEVALPEGQTVLVRELPVERAAVYVPGGRAPYPSTVVMGAVTARTAGVREVAVCAPPGEDGDLHPAILAACALCGVDEVYRMGGAQAVAALAFGTESVPAVDVLVGPGNLYVQEAKRQLSHRVGIDGFAGPSELLVVLAGDGARPVRPATLDLLAQA
jgi:histidinol dehydrogenase